MATKRTATTKKKASSGSDTKSKRIVKNTVADVMHEFKDGKLSSGKSGEKVKNPKQAIAIALSEARKAGATIPPPRSKAKKAAGKKSPVKRQK